MDKKKLESLVTLVGNQRVEDDFLSIKKGEGDTINLDLVKKALETSVNRYSSVPVYILDSLAKSAPERWTSTAYFFDKGNSGVTVHPWEPCHRGLSGCTSYTTFLAQYYPDNDSLPFILSMFADDGPFKSVVQDVSFVPVSNGVFAVFRNAKLPVKIFTNFLIWTRAFYQFRADKVLAILEGHGLSRKESIALAPVFYCSSFSHAEYYRFLLNSCYGDMPVYMDPNSDMYRGAYHPLDYLKGNVDNKAYDYKALFGSVNPNPCNKYLSRRNKNYFEYGGAYGAISFSDMGGKDKALKHFYSLIRYSIDNNVTIGEAYLKIGTKVE